MRFGKISLAAMAAAALVCAPVMARAMDSPAFTEKIEAESAVEIVTFGNYDQIETAEIAAYEAAANDDVVAVGPMVVVFNADTVRYSLNDIYLADLPSSVVYDNWADQSNFVLAAGAAPKLSFAGDQFRALDST